MAAVTPARLTLKTRVNQKTGKISFSALAHHFLLLFLSFVQSLVLLFPQCLGIPFTLIPFPASHCFFCPPIPQPIFGSRLCTLAPSSAELESKKCSQREELGVRWKTGMDVRWMRCIQVSASCPFSLTASGRAHFVCHFTRAEESRERRLDWIAFQNQSTVRSVHEIASGPGSGRGKHSHKRNSVQHRCTDGQAGIGCEDPRNPVSAS